MNGSRLPQGPGVGGPGQPGARREQWPGRGPRWLRLGLQLTARAGAPVPSWVQRGRFPGWRADVCTGVGVGAPLSRGRGWGEPRCPQLQEWLGSRGSALRPGTAYKPSLGIHLLLWSPGNPPGSMQPVPSPSPGLVPSVHHRQALCWGLSPPSPPDLPGLPHLGLQAPALGGKADGGQGPGPGPPHPGAGPARPCLRCMAWCTGSSQKTP